MKTFFYWKKSFSEKNFRTNSSFFLNEQFYWVNDFSVWQILVNVFSLRKRTNIDEKRKFQERMKSIFWIIKNKIRTERDFHELWTNKMKKKKNIPISTERSTWSNTNQNQHDQFFNFTPTWSNLSIFLCQHDKIFICTLSW